MTQRRTLFFLTFIILIGFALRLYQLDAVALRGDEGFSALNWAGLPIAESLSRIARIEPHPPLTYVIFRAWGVLVGVDTPFALRMLAVFGNILGIAGIFALGKRFSGVRHIGLLAAFLWAIHPFQIWHAQDFRNYALWSSLSIFTLYFGLRLIQCQRRTGQDWVRYGFVALLVSYVFYFELLTIGVLSLFALILYWRDWRFILRFYALNTAIIVFICATFVYVQGDLVSSGGYGGTATGFSLERYITNFVPILNFGETLYPLGANGISMQGILGICLSILFVILWLFLLRQYPEKTILLLVLALAPLVVIGGVSIVLEAFLPRYVMPVSIAFALTISLAIWHLWQKQRLFAVILASLWVGLSALSIGAYYTHPDNQKAPDWDTLASYLANNTNENELIIQRAIDAGFGYYLNLYNPPAVDIGLPRRDWQTSVDVKAYLASLRDDFNGYWTIGTEFRDWRAYGAVDQWLSINTQKVRDIEIAGLPVRQFHYWNVTEAINDAPLATYGDFVTLQDAKIFREPDNTITIWLYWDAIQQSDTSYTVFVHLVGDVNSATGSPLWAQDDHLPQYGRITTDLWATDTLYRDIYDLDLADVASGSYDIYVGFYDPATNARVLTNENADAYRIGTITLP